MGKHDVEAVFPVVFPQLIEVVDGDTFDLMLDLRFRTYRKQRCRLLRLDAPEKNTEAGKAVAKFCSMWIQCYAERPVSTGRRTSGKPSARTSTAARLECSDRMTLCNAAQRLPVESAACQVLHGRKAISVVCR